MSDRVPSYRKKATKTGTYAVVTLANGLGSRRDVILGRYGTKESREEYRRVLGEWETSGRNFPANGRLQDITIAELIGRYWPWVQAYYRRPDGSETQEVNSFLYTLRPLNHLYGGTPASAFGPIALKAVRELMIRGYTHPKYGPQEALSRGVINQRVKRIRRMFKWAIEQEIISPMVLNGLQSVPALKNGRTEAKEAKPVLPVARAVVEDTLPLLRPMQANMVMLQLESGMRPGELLAMRAADIDISGDVWLYRPPQHKTAHHGHGRIIPLGPKAQAIVRRYLVVDTQANLFTPAKNMQERATAMRARRQSKVQPSQICRRKKSPKKKPGNKYTVTAYGRGIAEAIKRHNKSKPEGEHIPHWHPHQLRHTRALELKRAAGLDVARSVLGHRSPVLTEHYASLDLVAAVEIMGKLG